MCVCSRVCSSGTIVLRLLSGGKDRPAVEHKAGIIIITNEEINIDGRGNVVLLDANTKAEHYGGTRYPQTPPFKLPV